MGMVFDQAHAMKTVLLNFRTVFVHVVLPNPVFCFYTTQTNPTSYSIAQRELVNLHNIIKLHYETF